MQPIADSSFFDQATHLSGKLLRLLKLPRHPLLQCQYHQQSLKIPREIRALVTNATKFQPGHRLLSCLRPVAVSIAQQNT